MKPWEAEFVGNGENRPTVDLPMKRSKVVARALTPRQQLERYDHICHLRQAGVIDMNEARKLLENDRRELDQLHVDHDQIRSGGDVIAWGGEAVRPLRSSGIEHIVHSGPPLESAHPEALTGFHPLAQYQLTAQGRVVLEELLMSTVIRG